MTARGMTVAVLGAGGTMGLPMARNIARAGIGVRVWNRTVEQAWPLADDGVQIAESAAGAADGADVILTMLADADAVLASADGEEGAPAAARDGAVSSPPQAASPSSRPPELRERLRPIFDALAQRTMWLGDAGAGTRLKVVLNGWVVAVVETGAETIALAEAMDVDPALMFEALDGGALDPPHLTSAVESGRASPARLRAIRPSTASRARPE
jgi:3-hydroxyisobutyrate dehydrogenase